MRIKTILNAEEQHRTSFEYAETSFCKFCRLKNLRAQTLSYYKEVLTYLKAHIPVAYVDEITQEIYDDFIFNEI